MSLLSRLPRGVLLTAARSFHQTPLLCNMQGGSKKPDYSKFMERFSGASKFQYELIMPNDKTKPKTTFKDVGGQSEAKEELVEIVDFLCHREKYTALGARIPSGALLSGPPGNGKTLLARAIAGEADVPFISCAGPQFIEKIGGLGPKRMRELFKTARDVAPCILFIDEIDAIGGKRSGSGDPSAAGAGYEGHNTINQMLVEMDGMNSREEIFVICATNIEDVLDSALTRPGRLDRKIYIDNPTELDRIEIFRIHMSNLKLDVPSMTKYCIKLAEFTPGCSGAEIANVCNEAALLAARFAKSSITADDFEAAIERISVGLERKNTSVTLEDLNKSAYYEAGQAFLSWILPTLTPVLKMSINAKLNKPLGFVQFAPRKDLLASKEHMLELICRGLAGRAAQNLFCNTVTDQARDDLKRITELAYSYVADHGFGKCAPNLSYHKSRSQKPRRVNMWSDKMQAQIDGEVREIIDHQYEKAVGIISEHKDTLKELADGLIKDKSLKEEDIKRIIESHNITSNSFSSR